jgi:hypothetical protein
MTEFYGTELLEARARLSSILVEYWNVLHPAEERRLRAVLERFDKTASEICSASPLAPLPRRFRRERACP